VAIQEGTVPRKKNTRLSTIYEMNESRVAVCGSSRDQSIAGWGRMHEILSLVNIAASSAAA
jgi:hypothetical protein